MMIKTGNKIVHFFFKILGTDCFFYKFAIIKHIY
jgi:hypothetical protein